MFFAVDFHFEMNRNYWYSFRFQSENQSVVMLLLLHFRLSEESECISYTVIGFFNRLSINLHKINIFAVPGLWR